MYISIVCNSCRQNTLPCTPLHSKCCINESFAEDKARCINESFAEDKAHTVYALCRYDTAIYLVHTALSPAVSFPVMSRTTRTALAPVINHQLFPCVCVCTAYTSHSYCLRVAVISFRTSATIQGQFLFKEILYASVHKVILHV